MVTTRSARRNEASVGNNTPSQLSKEPTNSHASITSRPQSSSIMTRSRTRRASLMNPNEENSQPLFEPLSARRRTPRARRNLSEVRSSASKSVNSHTRGRRSAAALSERPDPEQQQAPSVADCTASNKDCANDDWSVTFGEDENARSELGNADQVDALSVQNQIMQTPVKQIKKSRVNFDTGGVEGNMDKSSPSKRPKEVEADSEHAADSNKATDTREAVKQINKDAGDRSAQERDASNVESAVAKDSSGIADIAANTKAPSITDDMQLADTTEREGGESVGIPKSNDATDTPVDPEVATIPEPQRPRTPRRRGRTPRKKDTDVSQAIGDPNVSNADTAASQAAAPGTKSRKSATLLPNDLEGKEVTVEVDVRGETEKGIGTESEKETPVRKTPGPQNVVASENERKEVDVPSETMENIGSIPSKDQSSKAAVMPFEKEKITPPKAKSISEEKIKSTNNSVGVDAPEIKTITEQSGTGSDQMGKDTITESKKKRTPKSKRTKTTNASKDVSRPSETKENTEEKVVDIHQNSEDTGVDLGGKKAPRDANEVQSSIENMDVDVPSEQKALTHRKDVGNVQNEKGNAVMLEEKKTPSKKTPRSKERTIPTDDHMDLDVPSQTKTTDQHGADSDHINKETTMPSEKEKITSGRETSTGEEDIEPTDKSIDVENPSANKTIQEGEVEREDQAPKDTAANLEGKIKTSSRKKNRRKKRSKSVGESTDIEVLSEKTETAGPSISVDKNNKGTVIASEEDKITAGEEANRNEGDKTTNASKDVNPSSVSKENTECQVASNDENNDIAMELGRKEVTPSKKHSTPLRSTKAGKNQKEDIAIPTVSDQDTGALIETVDVQDSASTKDATYTKTTNIDEAIASKTSRYDNLSGADDADNAAGTSGTKPRTVIEHHIEREVSPDGLELDVKGGTFADRPSGKRKRGTSDIPHEEPSPNTSALETGTDRKSEEFFEFASNNVSSFIRRDSSTSQLCRGAIRDFYREQSVVEFGERFSGQFVPLRPGNLLPLGPLLRLEAGQEVDSDQLWEEIELRNKPFLAHAFKRLRQLSEFHKDSQQNASEDNAETKESDLSDQDPVDPGAIQEAENTELHDQENGKSAKRRVRFADDLSEDSSSDGENQKREDLNDDDSPGIEDGFFSISEMEHFAGEAEELAEAGKLMASDDESDEEGMGHSSPSGDADEPTSGSQDNLRYADFFDPPSSNSAAGDRASKISNVLEIEEELEEAAPTPLDISRAKIRKTIEAIEEENVGKKPWQLRGEITGHSRPKDSLLDATMEHDIATKPKAVIDTAVNRDIEGVIRQRIVDDLFDDVVKALPEEYEAEKRSKSEKPLPEVSQEKPTVGLGELYAQEFMEEKNKHLQNTLASQEVQKETDKPETDEQREVSLLFDKLSAKLDSLSSLHFTPSSAKYATEMVVSSNTKALAAEEAIPDAVSDGALLAPREIYSVDKNTLVGENERTKAEKKAKRRKTKSGIRKEKQIKSSKERILDQTDPHKAEKRKAENALARRGKKLRPTKETASARDFERPADEDIPLGMKQKSAAAIMASEMSNGMSRKPAAHFVL